MISPSETTIILDGLPDSENPISLSSAISGGMRFVNTLLKFPSSKTATGILGLLKNSRPGVSVSMRKLITAGVFIILLYCDEVSNTVFLIPPDPTVSMPDTNSKRMALRFFTIGCPSVFEILGK